MSIEERVNALEGQNTKILEGLNTLIEQNNDDAKKQSEKSILIKARDEEKKAIIEAAEEQLKEIDEKYGPKLKALGEEATEKVYSKIESGGRAVGAVLGFITKPVKRATEGVKSQL